MPTEYFFITKWRLEAPLEKVWDAIYNSTEWPTWWKGVIDVKQIEFAKEGMNAVRQYTWKSALPYTLSFQMRLTEMELHKKLSGIAFGELQGKGTWYFKQEKEITYVEYHWNVITTKAWMNTFSFLLKPAFQYNHNVVMKWGAFGLAQKLNAHLISF
jgi:hypothetical protein